MKLTKENIYVDLRGKSKEELTDLYNFLKSVGEKQFRDSLNDFLDSWRIGTWIAYELTTSNNWVLSSNEHSLSKKTEVTIQQLKEILQPMGKFTPIAMKCTQEQFEAIEPKLKGLKIEYITSFYYHNYLINNLWKQEKSISNIFESTKGEYNRVVHETWNEEIFLKACGIEVESLDQQLQKAKAEVERLEKEIEENKPKVGDWVYSTSSLCFYEKELARYQPHERKITNLELIKLLEQEMY